MLIYILQIWLPDRLLDDHSSMKVVTQTLYIHLLIDGHEPRFSNIIWLRLFVIVPKGKPFVDYVFQIMHSQTRLKRPYKTRHVLACQTGGCLLLDESSTERS